MNNAPTATPAIEIAGLHKSFGPVHAVDGIDLTIGAGEVVAFLGPNGAGKTTTLDIVLGLGQADAGTVQVLGTSPAEAVARGLVGAVMQTGGLLKDLTVRETVEVIASFYGRPFAVAEVLERAGITQLAGRLVGKCSGGEQQRLRFAIALVSDPALLILDEPTTGMDVNARRAFWDALREDARRGRTIVFATHYLEEAEEFAERIVLVSEGRLVADGTTAQVTAMAGGRRLRATLPSPGGDEIARLRALPGVTQLDVYGDLLIAACSDSDVLARHLLANTPARDVEISSQGLEEAFISLTATRSEHAR